MTDREPVNPLGRMAAGLVVGVALTWLYVRFGFALPGIARIGETVNSEAAVIAAEAELYNPAAPTERRRRALAVIVKERPDLFIEVDQSLGGPIFDEFLRRKAVRSAQRFPHLDNAYAAALGQPALRETLQRRHGTTDDEELKRRMFLADIARDEVLSEYLRRRFPDAGDDERAQIVRGVYRNGLKPAGVLRAASRAASGPQ